MSDNLVATRIRVVESPSILPLAENEIAGEFGTEALSDWPLALSAPAAGLIGRAARTGLMLSVHSELAAIECAWRAFEASAASTAFQSFDWLARWQRHIGNRRGTRPAVVLGRDVGGDLLFILPLALERRHLVRRLCWLGRDLCDYHAPILDRHFHEYLGAEDFAPVWHDILALLRTSPRFRFDVIDLQQMAIGRVSTPLSGRRRPAKPTARSSSKWASAARSPLPISTAPMPCTPWTS